MELDHSHCLALRRGISMATLILIWILAICALSESKTQLADIIPVCDLGDDNINECLKKSSQNILPTLAKGVKDWHLIGLDPILVPSIIIGQDSGPISLRWEHINTTISGMSKLTFTGASVFKTGDIYRFGFNFTTQKFSLIGDYKARGRMLFFPLKNEGHEEVYAGSSNLTINFEAEPKRGRDNVEYLRIQKHRLKMDFSKSVRILVENRNKKPTRMDKILSKFLTDNSHEIIKEMKTTFEESFGGVIQSYIQKFLEKVPLKQLFK